MRDMESAGRHNGFGQATTPPQRVHNAPGFHARHGNLGHNDYNEFLGNFGGTMYTEMCMM